MLVQPAIEIDTAPERAETVVRNHQQRGIGIAAHLREPGYEYKGTIASETAAAAKGGITTLVCTPDTDPVIDTPAVWELIRRRAIACSNAITSVSPLSAPASATAVAAAAVNAHQTK